MDRESPCGPEPLEVNNPPGASLPKRKMFADEQLCDLQMMIQHDVRKLLGGHGRQCRRELEKYDFIDAGGLEAVQLFLGTGQKAQLHVRCQHPDRMRIEGQYDGRALRL